MIEDLAGQLIGGRYRIRELVGIGGMDSTVWKAWQTGTERVVAVKVLPAAEEAAARRFARGARIAANLNHPNCTVVHDYGRTDDGKLFLVMEYLHGQVLQEILGPEGMSAPDTLHVADQVLQALEHAHSQRAVHRDLKPDNLFLSRKNDDPLHVKILDFGIAKYVEEDPDAPSVEEASSDGFEDLVTEQRQVCGTPQYMAPEQVVGARIDGRTDLYSLGVVMYRMLTGRLPFDGKTRYELYQKHLQEAPRTFIEVRPDLVFPDGLEAIVMKALCKRPEQRFQNAAEMRAALAAIDLPEDRLRRGVRPRVSFKHTSPQDHAGIPTVLPGGMWTLSQPAPGPAAVAPAPSAEPPAALAAAPVAPPPLPSALHRSRPSVPDAELALPPDLPLASVGLTPALGAPAADAPATTVAPSPQSYPAPVGSTTRDLLSAAVVRHPAGRSSLAVAPEVPRSTETEPNRAQNDGDRRRRRLGIAAVLAGAFLVGVGAVALTMHLIGPGDDGPAPEDTIAEDRALDPATEPARAVTAAGQPGVVPTQPAPAPAESADPRAGATAPTSPPVEAAPAEATPTTTAGTLAGHALSEVPVAPRVVKVAVKIESEPPGAIVSEGLTIHGPTPLDLSVDAGRHVFTLEREGYVNAIVEIDASTRMGAAPIARKIVLAPAPAAVTPTPAPRPRGEIAPAPAPRQTPRSNNPNKLLQALSQDKPEAPKPEVPKPEVPKTDNVSTPPTPKSPQVKLLDDKPTPGGASDGTKKPSVKLLDEDEGSAPKKPQVKVLGE